MMEQENKVCCIFCEAVTEPTGEAAMAHLKECKKHPLGKALDALRYYAKGGTGTDRARNTLFVITGEGSIDMRFL